MKVLSGNSNIPFATKIAAKLGTSLVSSNISNFADGEICVELIDELAGQDVVVVQSISKSPKASVNDNLMELLFIMDALNRIPAASVMVLLPYLGYARQDRRVFPQSPISSKVVIDQICNLGADYAVTLDIHAEQLLGFFSSPVKNLYALPVLLDDIKKVFKDTSDVVIVAPDMGAAKKTRFAAELLGCDYAIVDKARPKPGESMVMNVIGNFEGKDCILLDDMIDSAGTLCNAAAALMDRGAKSVRAYASHGVFSGKAFDRINASPFEEVVVSDSILHDNDLFFSAKIRQVSVADIFADVIKEHYGE